ncbi:uncharacterized protein BO88DRAFT_480717 [Aspergillus vadensis CBS 113365]|uniref:Protein kinase domain-containing protein n=1 Tax=Aspergillus vadensis (strain CBS 113365 / IMI 142717 / IBT 24658) TaxID=1448311 RepID=A0A319BE47_ASPVC|nr:hypothetical protein BO88DRAFT_480717 [Aspergillus vadensis CBS 113365]PYH70391.1 hypothetical protein BO88DRAFT_480717 [Aspergillus vadensis CBS 113365]
MIAQAGPPQSREALPPYDILGFWYGAGTASELTIYCYGKRFNITVSAESLQGDLNTASEYLSLLQKLDSDEPFEQEDDKGDPMEELCFWIAFECNSQMKVLGSEQQPRFHTLYDWLDVQSSTPTQQFLQELTPHVELPCPIADFGIPVVSPLHILLPRDTTGRDLPQRPTKVFTEQGMTRFPKPTYVSEPADREISTLLRIQNLGLSNIIRAPKIHEFVESQDVSSKISGILMDYIEHHDSLGYIDISTTALTVRMKWISQIQHMIEKLHTAGIVWGDAKPDNILVGADDNLWIIDFGGSYTHGWVDEHKEGTMEGDSQALSRIVEFPLDKSSE